MNLPILYVDNHLLAVNKPAGLLSQGDSTGDVTVLTLGKAYLKKTYDKPGNVYLGLVHRLDRPASGAMVLARTTKAARRLSLAFRERRIKKRYVALVEGQLRGEGRWEDFMVKSRQRAQVVEDAFPGAKKGVLQWRAIEGRQKHTVVEVRLLTGRPHQIRCQFSHRGFPLLGDLRYGATQEFDGRNLALHSYSLTAPHPIGGGPLSVIAPLPDAWARLGGWMGSASFEGLASCWRGPVANA